MIISRGRHERSAAKPVYPVSQGTTALAGYYDSKLLGDSHLQVLSEVWVEPSGGFLNHKHENTEIISYILAGHLAHRDSLGHHSVMGPGEVQCISAGVGISHSEYNDSQEAPLHFLQIWIEPQRLNLQPSYAKQFFSGTSKQDRLCLMGSPNGRAGSLKLHQDVFVYTTLLRKNISVHYTQAAKRVTYIHVAKGKAVVNNQFFIAGDGAVVHHEKEVILHTDTCAEVLLFDLPYY